MLADMVNIVFVDPPPAPSGRVSIHPWDEIARQLKARPGEWALCLAAQPGPITSQINTGKYAALRPAGSFEGRSVTKPQSDGSKKYDIYIRYVGEPTESERSNDDDA